MLSFAIIILISGNYELTALTTTTESNFSEIAEIIEASVYKNSSLSCETNPCLNGGTCVEDPGSDINVTCVCKSPFTGPRCQCRSDLCPNEDLCGAHPQTRLRCIPLCTSIACHCTLQGYTADMKTKTCVDIDECVLMDVCSGENEICHNYPGSYSCGCLQGYERNNSTNQCEEVDECEDRNASCGPRAECRNTLGSHECVCLSGYFGSRCEDYDECANGADNCQQICNNTEGSYACSCFEGFEMENDTCVYIGNETCSMNCTWGFCVGDSCICNRGFKIDNETGICVDIDECESGPVCQENSSCINVNGSYVCQCLPGFQVEKGLCTDIDECLQPEYCGPFSICTNLIGNANCTCLDGYSLVEGTCEEIDECQTERGNEMCIVRNAQCVDLISSLECRCRPGFFMENMICVPAQSTLIGFLNYSGDFESTFRAMVVRDHLYLNFVAEIRQLLITVLPQKTIQVQILDLKPGSVIIDYTITSMSKLTPEELNDILLAFCQRINANSNLCLLSSKIALNYESLKYSVRYFNACNPDIVEDYCPSIITTCYYVQESRYRCSCKDGLRTVTMANGIPLCADVNECEISPNICGKNEVCENVFSSYNCVCAESFKRAGSECVEPCQSNICQNNGKCVVTDGNSYYCKCDQYFYGDHCEFIFNPSQESGRRLLFIVAGSLGAALIVTLALGTLCYRRVDNKRKLEVARVTEMFEKYYQNEAVSH